MTTAGQRMIRRGFRQLVDALRLRPQRTKRRPQYGPSQFEYRVLAEMQRQGLVVEHQVEFGPYTADIYLREHNTIVECDGTYWHTRPGSARKHARRDAWFRSQGIRTIRLWEHVFYRNPERAIEQIKRSL